MQLHPLAWTKDERSEYIQSNMSQLSFSHSVTAFEERTTIVKALFGGSARSSINAQLNFD